MMALILTIKRIKNINDGTIGQFTVKGEDGRIVLKGYTLEPAGPDTTERMKDRRVPQGKYNLDWHLSSRLKKLCPRIYNELVPKDRFILIHSGNYPEHTEGCILLGDSADARGVYNSKAMISNFIGLIKDKQVVVEIINEGV